MLENKIYFKGIKQDKSEILARALLYREPINKLESLKYVIKVDDENDDINEVINKFCEIAPLSLFFNKDLLPKEIPVFDYTVNTGIAENTKFSIENLSIKELSFPEHIKENIIKNIREKYDIHTDSGKKYISDFLEFNSAFLEEFINATLSILYTDKLNKSQEIHEIFNKNIATFLHCDVERIHYDKYNCSKR